ncbi:hypothetical protein MKQ70_29805 [Chitinophaga sedimenti]|uniref:hypothetical protein n=1 Tax=Chitinophaga sedimenti TaxID=2033606 RepID=UPI0020035874|nr:hypothetical protein [Chitinophaga sedimenti]MCK7558948.1 hypothetical protein [Chitinophaga sedimenti]
MLVEAGNPDTLRQLALALKPLMENYVVVLAAEVAGKAQVVVSIADNLVAEKGTEAPKIIKDKVAGLIKGGGGGQKKPGICRRTGNRSAATGDRCGQGFLVINWFTISRAVGICLRPFLFPGMSIYVNLNPDYLTSMYTYSRTRPP